MSHSILVTGAAGGQQGSTGRLIALDLLKQGIAVRAFVHKLDSRSDELRDLGAEVFEGDLLNPASVSEAMKGITRAYFSYPVQDGLLEAAAIFAAFASEAGLDFVVNNSQFQDTPDRTLQSAPSFRNLQHRLSDRVFDWATVPTAHIQAPPYYENVRALLMRSVIAQNVGYLPFGDGDAVVPLAGAQDVAKVAAILLASPNPRAKAYPLVSEVLSGQQIVDKLGNAIGRPIRYVAITDQQWTDAVKERINPHAIDHLTHLWQYFRSGRDQHHVTNTVFEVTGQPAQTIDDFFRANAGAFKSTQG